MINIIKAPQTYDIEAEENKSEELKRGRELKPLIINYYYGIIKPHNRGNKTELKTKIYKIEANFFDRCAQNPLIKMDYNSALYDNQFIFLDIEKTDLKRLEIYRFTDTKKKGFLINNESKKAIFLSKMEKIARVTRAEQTALYNEALKQYETIKETEPMLADALSHFKQQDRAHLIIALNKIPPRRTQSGHDRIKELARTYEDFNKHDLLSLLKEELETAKERGYLLLYNDAERIEAERKKWRLKMMYKEIYERGYNEAIKKGLTDAEAKEHGKALIDKYRVKQYTR